MAGAPLLGPGLCSSPGLTRARSQAQSSRPHSYPCFPPHSFTRLVSYVPSQIIPTSRSLPMLNANTHSKVILLLMSSSPQILQGLALVPPLPGSPPLPLPKPLNQGPPIWGLPCARSPPSLGLTCHSRARSTPALPMGCAGGSCPASLT